MAGDRRQKTGDRRQKTAVTDETDHQTRDREDRGGGKQRRQRRQETKDEGDKGYGRQRRQRRQETEKETGDRGEKRAW